MRTYVGVLLVILALLAGAQPALAGNGSVTSKGDGSNTLDLTVYIGDQVTPYSTALASWKDNFTKSNRALWVATNGLLRFGRIRLGRHPGMRSRADIVVNRTGHEAVSFSAPIPEVQTRLGSTDRVSVYTLEDAGAPMTTVHELGHYVFALGDEYLSNLWEKGANGVVRMRMEGDKDVAYCSRPSDQRNPDRIFPTHASLMYDNNYPADIYQFCAGDHMGSTWGDSTRTWWWTTDQHRMHRGSCWSVIARFFGVATPTEVPLRTGNPPDSPTFQELVPEAAVAVLVQNNLSAS